MNFCSRVVARDAEYFDFFMYSHSYSFNRYIAKNDTCTLTRKVDAIAPSVLLNDGPENEKRPKSGMHFFELFLGIIKLIFEDLKY